MTLVKDFKKFERIVRKSPQSKKEKTGEIYVDHPFDVHNVHPKLPPKVKKLFDDGYFSEATYKACVFLDNKIKSISGIKKKTGFELMMQALNEDNPAIKLNALTNDSEIDEQRGYRHICAGAMSGIRNPRAHEDEIHDDPDTCIDHLTFISMLLRKIEKAGYNI